MLIIYKNMDEVSSYLKQMTNYCFILYFLYSSELFYLFYAILYPAS